MTTERRRDGPVLAAVDRSVGASVALERAGTVASAMGLELAVCHVVEDPDDDIGGIDGLAASVPEAAIVVEEGRPFVGIIRAARRIGASLIFMGASGEHDASDAALGITVDRVVRQADRPVLVTRPPADEPYRSVLVGVDGSPESLGALDTARSMAPDASISAVYAYHVPGLRKLRLHEVDEAAIDDLRTTVRNSVAEQLAGDVGERATAQFVSEGRPVVVLGNRARANRADLVAVG